MRSRPTSPASPGTRSPTERPRVGRLAAHPVVDGLLANARAHAATGEWDTVRWLLTAHAAAAREHPELVTLRGEAELRTGHPREARSWLAETLPVVEKSGDRAALRRAINQMGVAEVELGALEDAERTLGRALELGRRDGDDLLVARATLGRAELALRRGDGGLAEAAAVRAAARFAAMPDPIREADALRVVAAARVAQSKLGGAAAPLARALQLAR